MQLHMRHMNYIITEVAELEEFSLANLWSSFDKQKYFSMALFFFS